MVELRQNTRLWCWCSELNPPTSFKTHRNFNLFLFLKSLIPNFLQLFFWILCSFIIFLLFL
jgi:hypothetical protein